MQMPLSEIADRYTILKLKKERSSSNTSAVIDGQFQIFANELQVSMEKLGKKSRDIIKNYITELYIINGEIWNLESDLRKGKEGELGLEEVGKRALLIRNLNQKRVEMKNMIAEEAVEGYFSTEIKVNHASEKDEKKFDPTQTIPCNNKKPILNL